MTLEPPDDDYRPEQTRSDLRAGLEASREMVRQSHELIALSTSFALSEAREDEPTA